MTFETLFTTLNFHGRGELVLSLIDKGMHGFPMTSDIYKSKIEAMGSDYDKKLNVMKEAERKGHKLELGALIDITKHGLVYQSPHALNIIYTDKHRQSLQDRTEQLEK